MRREKIGGATTATMTATSESSSTKTTSARVPSRPTVAGAVPETATMSDATTSGMTVMRIAFTHIVPMGSIQPTT